MAKTVEKRAAQDGTSDEDTSGQLEEAMKEYWLKILDEALEEMPELAKDSKRLRKSVSAAVAETMDGFVPAEGEENPLDLTDGELEEELQTEKTRLRRAERRLKREQELLDEEEARLKSFKRSRQAQEKNEKAEADSKMHFYAKSIISGDLVKQRKMPPRILSELKKEQRRLEAEAKQVKVHDPSEDPFLQDLAARLKPVLEKLS